MQIHSPLSVLPDSYYVHIGSALQKWAILEYMLMTIIWEALKLDNKAGRALTVGMNIPTLTGILRNLHRQWVTDPAITEDIRVLCNDIKEHVVTRNNLVHGIWTADHQAENRVPHLNYMKEAAQRILPHAEAVKPEQLRDFAEIVNILVNRSSGLLTRIRNAPAPMPDTGQ